MRWRAVFFADALLGILLGYSMAMILGDLCADAQSAQTGARGATITGEVRLQDPWGTVGREAVLRTVEVGGLECAVLVKQGGGGGDATLWCRPRQ